MPEKMKIVIHPDPSGPNALKVSDAMRQVLDWFSLASDDESNDDCVEWRLIFASTNSPQLTIEAEAFGAKGINVDEQARQIKANLSAAFSDLDRGVLPSGWVDNQIKIKAAKRIFNRNNNGISQTDFYVNGDKPVVINSEKADNFVRVLLAPSEMIFNKEWAEMGSIEATIQEVTTHYNAPALKVRERLSGSFVWCIIPENVLDEIAKTANFVDVWKNKRVRISGEIQYNREGQISRLNAQELHPIVVKDISLGDIVDEDFTGGLSSEEYLAKFREGEIV